MKRTVRNSGTTTTKQVYCLYFPDDGMYTKLMTLAEARALNRQFGQAYIINSKTAEVID